MKEYKKRLINNMCYYSILRKTSRNEYISNSFIVKDSEQSIIRRFRNKFRGKVKTFNLTPKNFRKISM